MCILDYNASIPFLHGCKKFEENGPASRSLSRLLGECYKAFQESNENNRPTFLKTYMPIILGTIAGLTLETGLKIPNIGSTFLFTAEVQRRYYFPYRKSVGKETEHLFQHLPQV